jgi:hypothetical protein
MPFTVKRCFQCGRPYSEEGNHDSACSYHPGRLRDADSLSSAGRGLPLDSWECCDTIVKDASEPMAQTCAKGRHVEAPPADPGPILRAVQAEEERDREFWKRHYAAHPPIFPETVEVAQRRVRRFLAGRLDYPHYETAQREGLRHDMYVLESESFGWLLELAGKKDYDMKRRRRLVAFVKDAEKKSELERAIEGSAQEAP